MVANRLQPLEAADTAAVYIIDPSKAELSWLKAPTTIELARTGLSQKGEMYADWSLKVMSEEAHGVIRAVDETAEVIA